MIIDVNVSLGHWPFRKLDYNTADSMAALMDRTGVDEAWVGAFEGIFYKDVQVANRDLAQQCRSADARLRPLAVINPNFPGWQDDMRECVESLGMIGVRLYPNYHGYDLTSPCIKDLLAMADEQKVFVQIAVRTDDERMHHWLVKVPPVHLAPFLGLACTYASVPIVVLNATVGDVPYLCAPADGPQNVFVEVSHIEGVNCIKGLIQRLGDSHVVFGTHAPYLTAESAHFKLKESDLSAEELDKITSGNARRILRGTEAG